MFTKPNRHSSKGKGISIILAELILIVVVVVISIALASWILGVWKIEQENFVVVPTLSIRAQELEDNPILELHVKNTGTKPIKILSIEIEVGYGAYVNMTNITIQPKTSINITISDWSWLGSGDPPQLIPGGRYRIKIYTDFGTYFVDVVANR